MNASSIPHDIPGVRPAYTNGTTSDAHSHGVCWGAVFAGAAGAASLSLVLLMLGVGLGLSSVSPWSSEGLSAQAFGVSTIVWLSFTQLAASGMGGYLAGRLRVRWTAVHTDEVYFRDTAHGFLAWSVATLVTAGLLGSAVGTIVSGGAKAGAAVAGTAIAGTAATTAAMAAPTSAMTATSAAGGSGYFVDALFRKEAGAIPAAAASAPTSSSSADSPPVEAVMQPADTSHRMAPSGEALRIYANAAGEGELPKGDATYLAQLVAQHTGISQAEAEKRVTDTFNRMQAKATAAKNAAQTAADKARKASAIASLWVFVSLLVGAFVASFAATLGGRYRDQF